MCWRVLFLLISLLIYLLSLTFVEPCVLKYQYFFMFNKIPLKPPLNEWQGCKVKHLIVCSAKGKFACTKLCTLLLRGWTRPSNNGIIKPWFSLRVPILTKHKGKTGCAQWLKQYPTVIFTPSAQCPVAQLSRCADQRTTRKAGENSERAGWRVQFHLYARAHTKHNVLLQWFSQDKPSTICGDGEAEMLMYQFHWLCTLWCAVWADSLPGEASLRLYTQKPVTTHLSVDHFMSSDS